MGDFDFLQNKWTELAVLGQQAANYVDTDPCACIVKLGTLGEKVASMILNEHFFIALELSQEDKLRIIKDLDFVPKEIMDIFYNLKKHRNKAVHENYATTRIAHEMLKQVHSLCLWFYDINKMREEAERARKELERKRIEEIRMREEAERARKELERKRREEIRSREERAAVAYIINKINEKQAQSLSLLEWLDIHAVNLINKDEVGETIKKSLKEWRVRWAEEEKALRLGLWDSEQMQAKGVCSKKASVEQNLVAIEDLLDRLLKERNVIEREEDERVRRFEENKRIRIEKWRKEQQAKENSLENLERKRRLREAEESLKLLEECRNDVEEKKIKEIEEHRKEEKRENKENIESQKRLEKLTKSLMKKYFG